MSPSQGSRATVSLLRHASTQLDLLATRVFRCVYFILMRPIVLSVDVMDISGETQSDITHNIVKFRLDNQGRIVHGQVNTELKNDFDKMNEQRNNGYCGSCYGGVEPESGCCQTCEDVRQAYVNRGWSFNNPDAIEQVRARYMAALSDGITDVWDRQNVVP